MLGQSGRPAAVNGLPGWSLLFAREPDLEYDFDETQKTPPRGSALKKPRKPSRRRPFLMVLLVVIVAGGAYLSSDPAMLMELIDQVTGSPPPAPPTSIPFKPFAPPAKPSAPPAPPATAPPVMTLIQPSSAAPMKLAPTFPTPLFSEGQRVMVFADPALPPGPVPLTLEAGESRTSFTVRPGATVTVLDGEFRNTTWLYAVRTEDGAKGWIDERRLKAKP